MLGMGTSSSMKFVTSDDIWPRDCGRRQASNPDTKAIEVTLTGFYISEKRVSCAQVTKQFESEFAPFDIEHIEKLMKAGREGIETLTRELLGGKEILKEYKSYTVEEMESDVWIGMVYTISFRRGVWPLWGPGWMRPSQELGTRLSASKSRTISQFGLSLRYSSRVVLRHRPRLFLSSRQKL